MRTSFLTLAFLSLALCLGACGGGATPSPYCDPATLLAPVLAYPNDGGGFIVGTTHLRWYYPSGYCDPEEYEAEVNTASDFSGTMYGARTTLPNSEGWPLPITVGTTYYWRVRATVGTVAGPWSSVWSFTGTTPCALADLVAPTPLFPEDGHEFWFDAPAYQWHYYDPTCEPEGYHLQVASDAAFTSMALDLQDNNPDTLWVPTGASLGDCQVYYWRVAATEGGVDGPFSDALSFYINVGGACPPIPCPMTGLVPPETIGPGGYEIVSSLTPTLSWDYPAFCDPEGFAIRLAPDYDLSTAGLQGGLGLTGTWSPAPLEPATQYWWDVAAIVPPALGPFSTHETFFTGPECASSSELGQPELISPANGEQVTDLYAWLHYTASSFGCIPDGWAADLETDSAFGGPNLLTTYMFPATNIITDELDDCTEYFWRIAAIQDSVQGPWSETGNFLTNFYGTCMVSAVPEMLSAKALKDLACLGGPGFEYDIIGYILQGEVSPIFAQDLDRLYWVIENPDWLGTNCWVLQEHVEVIGDASGVRFWNAPPLEEEEEPLVCSSDLGKEQCEAVGGKYVEVLTAGGKNYCECP
jgi:hypothetical protein